MAPGTSGARWNDYLAVGNVKVGARFTDVTPQTVTTRYYHTDHLGSVPIRIYEANDKLYSLDNRRLYAAQQAGASVNYRFATPGELVNAAMQGRFSAKLGVPLRIRGRGGQE